MLTYHEALPRRELSEGKGRCVVLGGRRVALFLVGGKVHAIEDECLHQGGPLSEGTLRGTTVICPWHQWEFNVTTGRNDFNVEIKVRTFPVRIVGDAVYVGLEPREEEGAAEVSAEETYRYVPVARVGDIADGKGKMVKIDARQIALYLVGGRYFALKNFCPHEGDPLWRGRIEDGAVICPNHGWRFDLETGKCVRHGDRDVRNYPVKVEGDRILIGV